MKTVSGVLIAVFITLTCTVFAGASLCADAADSPTIVKPVRFDALQVRSEGDVFVLSMPASALVMRIPEDNLIHGSAAEAGSTSPRYFYFERPSPPLVISGWFESAAGYAGFKKFWSQETAVWKRNGMPTPKNVKFSKVEKWDVVQYEVSVAETSWTHVRAHLVQAGTWIDVHLSTNKGSKDALLGVLKSIVVREIAP